MQFHKDAFILNVTVQLFKESPNRANQTDLKPRIDQVELKLKLKLSVDKN